MNSESDISEIEFDFGLDEDSADGPPEFPHQTRVMSGVCTLCGKRDVYSGDSCPVVERDWLRKELLRLRGRLNAYESSPGVPHPPQRQPSKPRVRPVSRETQFTNRPIEDPDLPSGLRGPKR